MQEYDGDMVLIVNCETHEAPSLELRCVCLPVCLCVRGCTPLMLQTSPLPTLPLLAASNVTLLRRRLSTSIPGFDRSTWRPL
jgi:hypothetical protein